MCGIVGYVGHHKAAGILIDGLQKLEYRGYDSAGICVSNGENGFQVYRKAGKLTNLKTEVERTSSEFLDVATSGIGHTRWATHGSPSDENAHPHANSSSEIVAVHNGIIENFSAIKENLIRNGHTFKSGTDSEVIPHLVEFHMKSGHSIEESVLKMANDLQGSNAIVLMFSSNPNQIFAIRIGNAGGITIGYGKDEMFIASDLPALLPHTNIVSYLNDQEMVIIDKHSVIYTDLNGNPVENTPSKVDYNPLSATKGEYPNFMLKEIYEQPEAISNSIKDRVNESRNEIYFENFPLNVEEILNLKRIILVGMGTSLHAGMVAKHWFERISGIPSEWDNSSEFRYRDPILDKGSLMLSISQSGETADTLAAMEEGIRKKTPQLTLCNYPGTQASRLSEGTLQIGAGLEIGVAATKTFTCTLTTLYMLAIYLGTLRKFIDDETRTRLVTDLLSLPNLVTKTLEYAMDSESIAYDLYRYNNFLFLGRGINHPIAMEGALKLKEISYIHAEGYPAGEMKHGPISLINEAMPVVAIAPKDHLYEKIMSNISEASARGAKIIAIASDKDDLIGNKSDHVLRLPDASTDLNPLLATIQLQLLSYNIAMRLGRDVDQPRNLAKSVTVE